MAIVFFNALFIIRLQNWQKKIDGQDAPSYPIKRWHPAYINYLAAFYDAHYQHPARGLFNALMNTSRNPTR